MKFTEKAKIEIIFGDGHFDRQIIKHAIEKNKDKYCQISLFIPKSGRKGTLFHV